MGVLAFQLSVPMVRAKKAGDSVTALTLAEVEGAEVQICSESAVQSQCGASGHSAAKI